MAKSSQKITKQQQALLDGAKFALGKSSYDVYIELGPGYGCICLSDIAPTATHPYYIALREKALAFKAEKVAAEKAELAARWAKMNE